LDEGEVSVAGEKIHNRLYFALITEEGKDLVSPEGWMDLIS
jgi:hypothetical protein